MGRVLSDEDGLEVLHRCLDHPRPARALADAGDTVVGVDLDEQPVARPAEATGHHARLRLHLTVGGPLAPRRLPHMHEEGLHVDDLHASAASFGLYRWRPSRPRWRGSGRGTAEMR